MISTSTFALTKIQPPRVRAGLVVRGALESRLHEALATQRLVLLCAPAGFGKTAALTRALGGDTMVIRSAWVSLDEDDDLQRLLACLFAALEPFDPPWRVAPEALVAAAGRARHERRQAVDELINTLAATDVERAVIVLDDLHRVEDPAVFEFLELLIERLPVAWGLVVSSRVEPPFALARWRATDEVAEFREPDLRFDAADVAALAQGSEAAALHPADLELLLARTGGWVAGLRLALRNTPGGDANGLAWARAGTAMDRHAFDYLASEVLEQLPADLSEFLLRTSVLPELSASRCAALLNDAAAPRHLIEIERRGLFATLLDGPELTLRLHDLFRDFLEDRLRRSAAVDLPALLARAAASEPDDARRVGYLLRAGDWMAAETALQAFVPTWLSLGLLAQSQRLLEQFPTAWREQSARLALLQGLAAWARWDFAAMDSHFAAAQRLASTAGDVSTRLRAAAYVALSNCQMDRRDEAVRLIAELRRETLPDDAAVTLLTASTWHAGDYGPVAAVAGFVDERNQVLARSDELSLWYQATPNPRDVMLPGMRGPLTRFVEQAMLVVPDQANALGAILALMHGLMALWDGDAVTAAQRLARADDAARWLGRPRNVSQMLALATGLLHSLRGDIEGCRVAIGQLLADPDNEPPGPRQAKLRRHIQFQAMRLAIVAGDMEHAQRLAAGLGAAEPVGTGRIAQLARELALPAFAAELAEDWPLAAQRWQAALATPEALEWYGLLTEAQLRAAAALLRSAQADAIDAATSLVEQARQRCDADGWPGSALLAGPAALSRLASGLPPGSAATQAQAWLAIALRMRRPSLASALPLRAAWTVPAAAAPSRTESAAASVAADTELSERERQVLEHIAAGDSNKLIARALDLSPHTVKRHVANILDKLGLASRGQAAAWLRAHP